MWEAAKNLLTKLGKHFARERVNHWPARNHAGRAWCSTDWGWRFPVQVVAGWLGQSPLSAAQHYLRSRDAQFELAAGVGGVGEAAANPATHVCQCDSANEHAETQNPQSPAALMGLVSVVIWWNVEKWA